MSPDTGTSMDDVTNSWIGQIPVGQVLVFLGLVVGFTVWAWRSGRKIRSMTKPLESFLRDWQGEDARPGVDERPGVMKRLKTIEAQTSDSPTRTEFNALVGKVERNTAIVDLVRPHVVVDLPKEKP